MRPAFYGPFYRFLNSKIYCKRIIGVATADEKEIFCEKLANIVSKIDTTRTKEEVYKGISKRLKLVLTESIPSFGVGSRAMAGNNSLFINKEDVDLLINGNEQEFLNNTVIHTIVHEAIHKLQFSSKPFATTYKGKSILGFIEGATELKSIEGIFRNKSHIDHLEEKRFNFASTPYNYAVAVMKQLEVIFGKEAVDRFAFRRDTKILDDLENLIGEKNYEALRSDLKIVGLNKRIKPSFENHQNNLCRIYFDSSIKKIQTQDEAEQLLLKMQEMDKNRIKEKDGTDTFFEDYYKKIASELKNRFPNISQELIEYDGPKFYPLIYQDEAIGLLDERLYNTFSTQNFDEFNNLDFSPFKRYRYTEGANVYEIITENGTPKYFGMVTNEGDTYYKYIKDKIAPKFIESNFKIKNEEDNKLYLSIGRPLSKIEIENQELMEVPLNLDKKVIYNDMVESLKPRGFWEKLRNKLTRTKALPPYVEKTETSLAKKSWELSPNEIKKINSHGINFQNINENQKKEEETDITK